MERKKQITVRVSDEEYDAIKQSAAAAEKSVSDVVREYAMQADEARIDTSIHKAIQAIRAYIHDRTAYIQRTAVDTDDPAALLDIKLTQDEIHEVNRKLRYVEEILKIGNNKTDQN